MIVKKIRVKLKLGNLVCVCNGSTCVWLWGHNPIKHIVCHFHSCERCIIIHLINLGKLGNCSLKVIGKLTTFNAVFATVANTLWILSSCCSTLYLTFRENSLDQNKLIKLKQLKLRIQQFALGNILYKDLFGSFPYRNTIDMVELSGADLESSLSSKSGTYIQVQGGITNLSIVVSDNKFSATFDSACWVRS